MRGVDISHYQAGLTIQQLKNSGIDFAIIKLTEGTTYVDPSAFEFYKEAYTTGFPVGCYCYSHALNAQQAMAEAAYLMDTIKGFPMPCGIYIDIERDDQLALPENELRNVILGWCAGIGGRGYIPGVYGSEGTLWAKVNANSLPVGTLVWVARWSSNAPNTPCDLWQTSDKGHIDGYGGPVDTDEVRSDYLKHLIENGYPKRVDEAAEQAAAAVIMGDGGNHPGDATEMASDACPIGKPDAVVMALQMIMAYAGYWSTPTGIKSPEFFAAARQMLTDLSKG